MEGPAADPQLQRRARAVAPLLVQNSEDLQAFRLRQRALAQRRARARRRNLATDGVADVQRHVARRQPVAAGQHDHLLDRVAQLADVARPGVGAEHVDRFGGEPLHRFPVPDAELLQEEIAQGGDVAVPLGQRRHVDVDDIQPVEQILAELSLADHLVQIAIGGGNQADVDGNRLGAPHALELPLLDHAEQLHLDGVVDLADLVQKQRAADGHLEAPLAARIGAREGPLLVSEEFAFEQGRRQGRAVYRDIGAARPRAEAVQRMGHQFLARAAGAGDQHRRLGRRRLADGVEDRLHDLRVADDVLEAVLVVQLLFEVPVFGFDVARAERARDQHVEVIEVHGLGQEVVSPLLHGLDGRFDAAVGGQQDADDIGMVRLDPLQQLEPVHSRHPHVGEHDIDGIVAQGLHGPRGVFGQPDFKARAQRALESLARVLVVIHNQDDRAIVGGRRHISGSPLARRASLQPAPRAPESCGCGARPAAAECENASPRWVCSKLRSVRRVPG